MLRCLLGKDTQIELAKFAGLEEGNLSEAEKSFGKTQDVRNAFANMFSDRSFYFKH